MNQFLFGETGRLFSLGHLWFLWYLLVFVTVAPVVSGFASWATTRVRAGTDMLGNRLSRYGLAPLVLGVTTHIVAGRFSAKYQSQTKLPSYEQIRGLGYGFYAVAAAYTS